MATRNKFTFEMVSVSFKKHWAVATGSLTRGQVDAPFRKDGLWLETVCQSWCNGGNLKRFGSHTFLEKILTVNPISLVFCLEPWT